MKNAVESALINSVTFTLPIYRKPRLPCVKGAVSAADWGIVFLQNQCLQSIQSLHIRESARVPDDFVQQIYIFSKLTYKWLSFPSRRSIIKSLEVRLPARLWHLVSGYLQGETLTIFYFASFSIFSMAFLSSSSVLHLSISSSTMRRVCAMYVSPKRRLPRFLFNNLPLIFSVFPDFYSCPWYNWGANKAGYSPLVNCLWLLCAATLAAFFICQVFFVGHENIPAKKPTVIIWSNVHLWFARALAIAGQTWYNNSDVT